MRKYAKIDDNQKQIVKELRKIGCVVQSLAAIGNGCPDLLVSLRGVNYLFEIKDGKKFKSAQALTDDEKLWIERWKGQVDVCTTTEEIMAIIAGK